MTTARTVRLATAQDAIRAINLVDAKVEKLDEERDSLTSTLTAAAYAWEKQGGKSLRNPGRRTYGCTACSLVYDCVVPSDEVERLTAGQLFPTEAHLWFTTTCHWDCGGGVGVDVPVSFVDRYLEEHQ